MSFEFNFKGFVRELSLWVVSETIFDWEKFVINLSRKNILRPSNDKIKIDETYERLSEKSF